jgi:pimeloyl-ACP methyl ester carboxylesterase
MSARLWQFAIAALTAVSLVVVVGCAGPSRAPATVRHADVNGARLAYVEQGDGAPVVLVHGSMSDYRTWDRQREALARHYRVIAYSQRYFGTEPWSPGWPKIGVPVQSDDLAAFIRSMRAGPVHLVGWSSGANVAINVALEHPELVKSAFAYEPALASVVTDSTDRQAIADDRAAAFGPAVEAVRAGDNATALRRVLDAVDNRTGALDGWPPAVQAVAMDNARTLPLEFFDSAPAPPITCAQLGQLKPVVAIARGERTRSSYRLLADGAAKCVGGSQHIIVPNARHLWPGDEPQAFSEAVLRFLKQQ